MVQRQETFPSVSIGSVFAGVEYGADAGLGLGLYVASAIVNAHHSSIEVESEADISTTFTVLIPSIVNLGDIGRNSRCD